MAVKIRKEFIREQIGPTIFNTDGEPIGQLPVDFLNETFFPIGICHVIDQPYDYQNDILVLRTLSKNDFLVKRGDTYEISIFVKE